MRFRKLELDAVNRAANTLDGAAGKSINVAKVLAILGAQPLATGFIGGEPGRALLELLASRKIETKFVSVSAPTRQCITILDESSKAVTELVEESKQVASSAYDSLSEIISKLLPRCRAVVMSGSLTPGGPVDFYRGIVQRAKKLSILSVVDAQGAPLALTLEAGPSLVKPNRQELAATVQRSLGTESEVVAAMQEIHQRGAARVVVTAGKLPALALEGKNVWRIRTPDVSVVNPIGSGDAFTAGLVWRLALEESLGDACRWAAAAGAANTLSAMPGELDRCAVEKLAEEVKVENL
jgi:tagatose 6-phosphate kinase